MRSQLDPPQRRPRRGALVMLFVLLFAVSHVLTLGLDVPAWLSVGVVSLVQGAASFAFDRGRPPAR